MDFNIVIDNYDEVEPILMRIDFEPMREFWWNWAVDEHIRLLKKNSSGIAKSIFDRVPTINALTDEKMKGQSMIYAYGIAKILSEIKEGETVSYANLKITKKKGKIRSDQDVSKGRDE